MGPWDDDAIWEGVLLRACPSYLGGPLPKNTPKKNCFMQVLLGSVPTKSICFCRIMRTSKYWKSREIWGTRSGGNIDESSKLHYFGIIMMKHFRSSAASARLKLIWSHISYFVFHVAYLFFHKTYNPDELLKISSSENILTWMFQVYRILLSSDSEICW